MKYVIPEVGICISLRQLCTYGMNEELVRHRGRENKMECSLCGDECENESHVLWEYLAYSSTMEPPLMDTS